MKKIFKSVMLVAAAAMAFASCQVEIVAPETISTTLTLTAGVEDTKTYLDEDLNVLWGTGESVQLYVGSGETSKFVSSTATDIFDGEQTATFTFNLTDVAESDSYSLGGIYPASAAISDNINPKEFKTILPQTQSAEVGKYDPAAYIMVLKPETVSELPSEYIASFRRATALNKITLTDVKENITSVEITVPNGMALAGRRYFDLTSGESGEVYYDKSNTIIVNSNFTGSSIDVWFCSWGVELAAGNELTVRMKNANKSFTRTIKANEKGIKFVEGNLNTLKIDMSSATEESFDSFEGEWLITGTTGGKTYAAKAYSSGNNLSSPVGITVENDGTIYEVDGLDQCKMTFTKITEGDYKGMYTIQDANGKYLYAASSSGNHLKAGQSASDAHYYWTVECKDGKYSIVASKSSNRNVMQFNPNNGSPIFSCYSSASQTAVVLYPYSNVKADTTPKILVDGDTIKNIGSEGGDVTFNYTLKNLDGQTLNLAVSNSEMLSASATDGVITVNVNENDGEAREATITLTCGEAEDVVLTVKQAAWEEPNTGGGDTQEYTYTWTASSGALGTTTNGTTTMTLNNVDWTIQRSDNSGYTGWANNVIQIGSKSNPENLTLTTSAISGTIKSVSVACASYQAKHNINISVGGVSYVSNSTPSWSNNSVGTVVGEGNSTGDIEIKFTKGSGARALYVKSITIVYEN